MSQIPYNMDIDVNCNIIKGRSTLSSKADSRNSSVFSSTSLVSYHKCMELNNNFPEDDIQDPINSSQLSYERQVDVSESIRKITDKTPNERTMCFKQNTGLQDHFYTTRQGCV